MKTLVMDGFGESPVKIRAALSNLDKSYDRGALILIGHGSDRDFMGLTSEEIMRLKLGTKVIWFYACNCGQSMIGGFAGSGTIAAGHCCYVLRFPSYDLALDTLKKRLDESDEDIDCSQLMSDIRATWFDTAKKCIERKDLLFAAITNHTRLSMRFSS